MLRAMIVEDELLVRIGIRNIVPWQEYGIGDVRDFASGDEAWEAYKTCRADIVVTDLRMNGMDGMELIERIRRMDEDCRMIILTCVEDVSLLQRAITHSVTGYLLKLTMTTDELCQTIQKAVCELSTRRAVPVDTRTGMDKAALLRELIAARCTRGEAAIGRALRDAGVRLSSRKLYLGIMETAADRASLAGAIEMLVDTRARESMGGAAFCDGDTRFVSVWSGDELDGVAFLRDLGREAAQYFGCKTTSALSDGRDGFLSLALLYRQALRRLEYAFYTSESVCSQDSDARAAEAAKEELGALSRDETWKFLLPDDTWPRVTDELNEMGDALPAAREACRRLREYACLAWREAANVWRVAETEAPASEREPHSLREAVRDTKDVLAARMREVRAKYPTDEYVLGAIRFAIAHLHENLSLHETAKRAHLSANYFSNLFHRDMGLTYTDFLNGLRVDEARKMLAGTGESTLSIALRLGFSDCAYFCRVFRRVAGMSPGEYRKRYAGREDKP